jgi:cathepsin A (carboxypeptidase C)
MHFVSVRVFAAVVCLAAATTALPADLSDPHPDLISFLPGLQGWPRFRQFSGYLSVPGTTKRLHYWYVESQSKPESAPLVLWMNGGPGCSSMEGLIYENGPFQVSEDGKRLNENPYSWNLVANMLYLEAPAGVGFSYATSEKDLQNDDFGTADDNYHALLDFFGKFPELQGRPFFVTGESYGGVYVPTLAQRIIKGNAAKEGDHINLQAAAIGNGLTSFQYNDDSAVEFAYFHGLFGDTLWATLQKECCTSGKCDFHTPQTKQCGAAIKEAMADIYSSGINYYGIYGKCTGSQARSGRSMDLLFRNTPEAHATRLESNVPCIDSNGANVYFNDVAVRKALHIVPDARKWAVCSDILQYNITLQTTRDVVLDVLDNGVRILYYNGDTDLACNFLGDQRFVDALGRPLVQARRKWMVEGQIAGFVEEYKDIVFTTVRGAGHMVPQDRPVQALAMFEKFLQAESL